MKHDFEAARRGAVIRGAGKTRVTMYLDDDVIEHFRERATANGRGYQTEINAALRAALADHVAVQAAGEIKDMASLKLQVGELVRAVGRIEKSVHGVQYARARPGTTVRDTDSPPRYAAKAKRVNKPIKGA